MTKLEKAKEAAEDEGAYLRYQEELKALTKDVLLKTEYFNLNKSTESKKNQKDIHENHHKQRRL